MEAELETTREILNSSVAEDFESVELLLETKKKFQGQLEEKEREDAELRHVHASTLATVLWNRDRVDSIDEGFVSPEPKQKQVFDKAGFAAFLRGESEGFFLKSPFRSPFLYAKNHRNPFLSF